MRGLGLLVAAVTVAACGGSTAKSKRVPVTVLVTGDADGATNVRGALARASDLPVDLRFVPIPNDPPATGSDGEIETRLADARAKYVDAEFKACIDLLDIDATELLAQERRSLAARVLFWRIACRVGADDRATAARDASRFAVFGLDAPEDVAFATPDVETLVSTAIRDASRAPRVEVVITADRDRARVVLDGKPADCATTCNLDLLAGDHVVRIEADGATPSWRVVRVDEANRDHGFELQPAPPKQAARQWTARYAGSPAIDTIASMKLLSLAVRSRTLVLVTASGPAATSKVRGVLAVDGDVVARAERAGAAKSSSLMRELLVRGDVVDAGPPLHKRPVFWVVVGLTAAAAAVVTGYIVYEPGQRQEVGFP